MLQEVSRHRERDRATGAVAGDHIWASGPEGADLRGKVRCQILHACEGLALTIDARRLQPEEGLIVAQVLCQGTVAEHVATMPGHGKNWNARSAGLQRHDGSLLLGKRLGRAEECENIALALPQLSAQLGRQNAGWSTAAQLVAISPDLNVAAAQFLKQRRHDHSSISSRSLASWVSAFALATQDSPSMTSASPATVGRSKRLRRGRSTSKTSRIRDTALIATKDCPPRSKKSSLTPMFSTYSNSLQMAASAFSVSVRGPTTS